MALVEFAILMPLLFMLILGMFTGGLAYSRSIAMNNAAREAARYGASLPLGSSIDTWLRNVAGAAMDAATGDMNDTVDGQFICVAYVHPGAVSADGQQVSRRLIRQAGAEAIANGVCPGVTDSRPATERRVHVHVRRTSKFEGLFFSRDLTLDRWSVSRYERS